MSRNDPLGRLEAVVDHGAADAEINPAVIRKQLMTAAALAERLEKYGCAILGDEVGTGKTYVALALVVEAIARDPDKGVIVLVPKSPLASKWKAAFELYVKACVKDTAFAQGLLDRVVEFDRSLPAVGKASIVIGRHDAFMGKLSNHDIGVALRAYLELRSGRARKRYAPWLRACGITGEAAEGYWSYWADPELFRRRPALLAPLDGIFAAYDAHKRISHSDVRHAVWQVRLGFARARLPRSSVVIIDEAHNLRNPGSRRYTTISEVLRQKFDALLFLTATPFQLDPEELELVLAFSRSAARVVDPSFERRVREMVDGMRTHITELDAFWRAWCDLDAEAAAEARDLVDRHHEAGEHRPSAVTLAKQYTRCLETKQHVESALRPFLVRSVEAHRRHELSGLPSPGVIPASSRIPLALTDRLLTEIFAAGRSTFVASALISACSSWPALMTSAVMRDDRKEGTATRTQLRVLDERHALGRHPKVEATVTGALNALERGEKTLIFVERQQTGLEILQRLTDHLADTEGTASERERGRLLLQDRTRLGWPALRENYLHTIYPIAFGQPIDLGRRDELAARYGDLFHRIDTGSAKPRDYSSEKRYWEHVYVRTALHENKLLGEAPAEIADAVRRIADERYPLNGLDLEHEDTGLPRPEPITEGSPRGPQSEFAAAYLRYQSPWAPYASQLAEVEPVIRARFVDRVARAIGLSHLRVELIRVDYESRAEDVLTAVELIVANPDSQWPERFESLVHELLKAVRTGGDEDELGAGTLRVQTLLDGLVSRERTQFVRAGDLGTHLRAIAGFNTPMYPDVLIATDVFAEGIDLHRQCRRVTHHDLPWNPARLEQRTGRVERRGSLSERRLARGEDAPIEVRMPYVPGTYDAFVFSRVMSRRQQFRCLLGERPEFDSDEMPSDEAPQEIPTAWLDALQINLAPEHSGL